MDSAKVQILHQLRSSAAGEMHPDEYGIVRSVMDDVLCISRIIKDAVTSCECLCFAIDGVEALTGYQDLQHVVFACTGVAYAAEGIWSIAKIVDTAG